MAGRALQLSRGGLGGGGSNYNPLDCNGLEYGYDGDPLKPGSLYFSLQFDNQPEVYPTLFRDCKMCPPVRDFIKGIVSDNPESNFKRLIPLLREEAPRRRRKRNQLLGDLG